jgi:hypothetical protein
VPWYDDDENEFDVTCNVTFGHDARIRMDPGESEPAEPDEIEVVSVTESNTGIDRPDLIDVLASDVADAAAEEAAAAAEYEAAERELAAAESRADNRRDREWDD